MELEWGSLIDSNLMLLAIIWLKKGGGHVSLKSQSSIFALGKLLTIPLEKIMRSCRLNGKGLVSKNKCRLMVLTLGMRWV